MNGLPVLPGYVFEPTWQGLVSLALTLLLPVLVGLLATRSWSAAAKGLLLIGLAGVKAVGEAFIAGEFGWTVVYSIVASVLLAVAAHFGFYRAARSDGGSVATWAIDHGRAGGTVDDGTAVPTEIPGSPPPDGP